MFLGEKVEAEFEELAGERSDEFTQFQVRVGLSKKKQAYAERFFVGWRIRRTRLIYLSVTCSQPLHLREFKKLLARLSR